jgi:hypothetical protein
MNIPPLKSKIDQFIPIELDPDYKPKQPNLDKIKNYKIVE